LIEVVQAADIFQSHVHPPNCRASTGSPTSEKTGPTSFVARTMRTKKT